MNVRFGFQFVTRQNRRVGSQAEVRGVFALQLKSNRFLYILHEFVEGRRLGDDRQIEAFSYEVFFPAKNADMNDSLHTGIIAKFFDSGKYSSSEYDRILPNLPITASALLWRRPEHRAAAHLTDSPNSL